MRLFHITTFRESVITSVLIFACLFAYDFFFEKETAMPTQTEFSSNVRFLPHIGKNYGDPEKSIFEKRVCIVGASHYTPDIDDFLSGNGQEIWQGMTRKVITDYLDPSFHAVWKRTYSSFINAVFGRATTPEERKDFFDSVLFFNYLQRPEGRDGNESHPELYADDSHFRAFCEIVEKTHPEIIIVWGSKVWNALSSRFPDAEVLAQPRSLHVRDEARGFDFVLLGVRHPCSAFPKEQYHSIFKDMGVIPIAVK